MNQPTRYEHKGLIRKDRMGLINHKVRYKIPLSDSDREYVEKMTISKRPLF